MKEAIAALALLWAFGAQAVGIAPDSAYYVRRIPNVFEETGLPLPGVTDYPSNPAYTGAGGWIHIGRNDQNTEIRAFAEFVIKGLDAGQTLGFSYPGIEAQATFINGVAYRAPYVGTVTIATYRPAAGVQAFDPVQTGIAATFDAGVPFGSGMGIGPWPRYTFDVTDSIARALDRNESSIGFELSVAGPSFVPNEYRLMNFSQFTLTPIIPVPEPETYALMLVGLSLMVLHRRRA